MKNIIYKYIFSNTSNVLNVLKYFFTMAKFSKEVNEESFHQYLMQPFHGLFFGQQRLFVEYFAIFQREQIGTSLQNCSHIELLATFFMLDQVVHHAGEVGRQHFMQVGRSHVGQADELVHQSIHVFHNDLSDAGQGVDELIQIVLHCDGSVEILCGGVSPIKICTKTSPIIRAECRVVFGFPIIIINVVVFGLPIFDVEELAFKPNFSVLAECSQFSGMTFELDKPEFRLDRV